MERTVRTAVLAALSLWAVPVLAQDDPRVTVNIPVLGPLTAHVLGEIPKIGSIGPIPVPVFRWNDISDIGKGEVPRHDGETIKIGLPTIVIPGDHGDQRVSGAYLDTNLWTPARVFSAADQWVAVRGRQAIAIGYDATVATPIILGGALVNTARTAVDWSAARVQEALAWEEELRRKIADATAKGARWAGDRVEDGRVWAGDRVEDGRVWAGDRIEDAKLALAREALQLLGPEIDELQQGEPNAPATSPESAPRSRGLASSLDEVGGN